MKSVPAWESMIDESWITFWEDRHFPQAGFMFPKNAYVAGREWSRRTGKRVRVFFDGYLWRFETIEERK